MKFDLILNGNAVVETPGVDWEIRAERMLIVARNHHHLALKVPGRGVWSGRGMGQRYEPTKIIFCEIIGSKPCSDGERLTVDSLLDAPIKPKVADTRPKIDH